MPKGRSVQRRRNRQPCHCCSEARASARLGASVRVKVRDWHKTGEFARSKFVHDPNAPAAMLLLLREPQPDGTNSMNFNDLKHSRLVPPMPPMASDDISGLQILLALRRDAYTAFPRRCLEEPVVKIWAAWKVLVLTCEPDVIRHVMMTHAEDYARLPLGRRVLGPIAGNGLLTSEGALWRRQRRAMAPAFAPRNISIMARHIMLSTEASCARLAQSCGTEIDLLSELQMLSLEIAASSMFSIEASAFGSELRTMISEYAVSMGRACPSDFLLPDGVPTPMRARRALFQRRWKKLIRSIVAVRREAKHDGDARDLFDLE